MTEERGTVAMNDKKSFPKRLPLNMNTMYEKSMKSGKLKEGANVSAQLKEEKER